MFDFPTWIATIKKNPQIGLPVSFTGVENSQTSISNRTQERLNNLIIDRVTVD